MKTNYFRSLSLASCLLALLTLPLAAQGPGRGGRGHGGGGGGGGHGGGPGGFQEAIHTLFDHHTKIQRSVELTDSGYRSRTVSDDPEIAKTLQKHVREMRERLGSGRMIRRWDPAFAELVEHYEAIDHEFKEVEGGVEMVASGKTPEAVKVAQNHARIVSGFVEKGPSQMHEKHATALTDGTPAPDHDHPHHAPSEQETAPGTAEPGTKPKACCPPKKGCAKNTNHTDTAAGPTETEKAKACCGKEACDKAGGCQTDGRQTDGDTPCVGKAKTDAPPAEASAPVK